MGKQERIELLVEGGNAKPDATVSQRLGPLKINIREVMEKINERTSVFKGMKVPVKMLVDVDTKHVDYDIGIPPVSELIKKELGIEKGSKMPDKEKIHNISVEQLIKIAKMKKDGMFVKNLKNAVKNVAGSCNSMGILVEGKSSNEFNKDLDSGFYDKEIQNEMTDASKDKQERLKIQLAEVQEFLRKEQERLKAAEEAEKKPAEEKVEEVKEEVKEEAKAEGRETKEAAKEKSKADTKEEKKK